MLCALLFHPLEWSIAQHKKISRRNKTSFKYEKIIEEKAALAAAAAATTTTAKKPFGQDRLTEKPVKKPQQPILTIDKIFYYFPFDLHFEKNFYFDFEYTL